MIEDGIKISELNTTTSVNDEDLMPIVQNDETKSITISDFMSRKYCRATITSEPTVTTNYYITLNSIGINTGEFTLENGGIKIPSGINHVRISGSVFLNNFPGGTNYLWTKIYRVRGTTVDHISGSLNNSTATFISTSVPEVITNVQEGDIIRLMADSPNGGKIRPYAINTWLMVEKVD